MYIVTFGALHYTGFNGEVGQVEKDACVSEAALWTEWIHRGRCLVMTDAALCTLSTEEFMAIVRQFDHPGFDPCCYAAAYVSDLNRFGEEVTDITDFGELA